MPTRLAADVHGLRPLSRVEVVRATGRPLLSDCGLCAPLFDTLSRGLPYALRGVAAHDGATAIVHIYGNSWTAVRADSAWQLSIGSAPQPAAACWLPA
jgi:hypothetical protein